MPPADLHVAVNGWFFDRPHTGSGQYVRNLLLNLLRVDPSPRITLIVPVALAGRISAPDGIATHVARTPFDGRGGHMAKVWFEQVAFPRACAQVGADVMHVPYWGSPLRARIPIIVTVHDIIPLVLPEYRGGPLARLYTALVSASAAGASVVITDSDASRRDIITHLRIPEGRVRTVYLAPGGEMRPQPDESDARVRSRYSLPGRYVLYLGGYDVRKNVRALIEAYVYVARVTDTPLLLAGREKSGNPRRFPPLRPIIERLGLDTSVRWLGWVEEEDKPALYRNAACFVFPSRYEGFGLEPLEAMACGAPVVCSDATSLPEVVGDAGLTVDPDDVQGLAGAILAILTQDDLAARLAERGLDRAARFSWLETARRTLDAYISAADRVATC